MGHWRMWSGNRVLPVNRINQVVDEARDSSLAIEPNDIIGNFIGDAKGEQARVPSSARAARRTR